MGYILRLTELNGYDTPAWIIREAGIRYISERCAATSHTLLDLSGLATLTGVNPADLESLRYPVYRPANSNFKRLFFNLPVSQYLIRPKHPKVCPCCLLETTYNRRIWEFVLVTACPLHKCLLLDECPNCRKRIAWSRNRVAICGCGFDWRDYNPTMIASTELHVTQQIHWSCQLVNSIDTEPSNSDKSNHLYTVDLQHFTSALLFIASQLADTVYKRRKRMVDTTGKNFARTMRNAEIHSLLCKAWAVFSDWPENYFQFLEWRRLHTPKRRFIFGLNRDFSEYKCALYQQLASEQLDFMRSAFEEYLVTKWDGGHIANMRRISPYIRMNSRYVSRKDAQKFLHIKVEGVDTLIALGKLKAVVRNNGRSRAILIERASLESIKHEFEHSLSLKQAAGILGISSRRVYELIECNLLRPFKGEGIDGRSDWTFRSEEIKCLLAAVIGRLTKGSRVATGDNISFLKALRKLVRVNIGIGQFIQTILDSTIRIVGVSTKPGVASLIFSKSDIKDYITELERIRLGETFSVPEVAKHLGIGVTNTHFLIAKGIVKIRRQAVKGHYDLRISKSAVDLFNSTYVLPAKLARQFDTTSTRLTNLLISHGVNPISGPKVDGGKQYVFRKTDIKQIDLGAIWRASESEQISRLNERKLIDARHAAKILDTDESSVLDLAERGILKLHRHVPSSRHKADGPFFSMFTIEKYKARTVDYSGLVSFTVAAEMLGVSVATLYRYIPKKLLQVALDEGEGRRYSRLKDVERFIEDRNNLRQQYITTAEVASICKVSKNSVNAWVGAGLLKPVSGPRTDGLVHRLYLRSDVEKLYAEREAFKVKRVSEGRSSRFGRLAGPNRQPVRNKVGSRIEQLVKKWTVKPKGQPISGQRIHHQLVKEGYRVGINTIYVCLRELRQQTHAQ